jgi:hypothetical protein
MGIRGKVSRSTIAYANENRDWRIYCDFAQILIHQARQLYANDDFGLQLQETVHALDATIIDLCLSVFPWARFRKSKGAIKLHTLLDLKGNIPSFIAITEGRVHEVNILDELIPEAGSIYIMDRGYFDFERLYTLHQCSSFFVVWYLRKCGEDSNLDSNICVCSGSHNKETVKIRPESLHNFTDF